MIQNRREHYKQGLHEQYIPFYEVLCNLLNERWQPYSGFRSCEEQDKLYQQGIDDPKKFVTNARGGESAHNFGCATDWTIFENGQPKWLHKEDVLWEEYQTAVWKTGLKWGGDFKSKDVDHNELKTWKEFKS